MYSKIYLSKPHLSSFELKYVEDAFISNWLTTKGDNINVFENDLRNYFNDKVEIVALNSGTSAIHLALDLLDVGKGDEVLCQSFTFVASYIMVQHQYLLTVK